MKVGDLVIRAYAWRGIVPGIIIEEREEVLEELGVEGTLSFTKFLVHWSDGTHSVELYEEIEYYEYHGVDGESW